jgi:cytochrome b561
MSTTSVAMTLPARYTLVQRLLHWLIAIVVFGLLAAGFLIWAAGGHDGLVKLLGDDLTNQLYGYHKSFGILLLILMVLRVLLRFGSPPPAYNPPLSTPERMLGSTVHLLLYLLLIAMPIVGWLATAAGGFPVQFFGIELPGFIGKDPEFAEELFDLHGVIAAVVAGLLVLHIGAGLKHWKLKDGIMRRISLP